MKISYFLYSLLVSIWIFTDAPIHKASRWWSIGAFILPLLVPYYFIKTRPQGKYWKYIGIWLLGFSLFYVAEFVIAGNKATINETKSPIIEEIKLLSFKSGSSAKEAQDALNRLDQMQDVSTITKINEVIKAIELVQALQIQANIDSDTLTNYVNKHRNELHNKGLDIFVEIEGLIGETYASHHRALKEYLDTYKAMLEYSRNNFDAILKEQQPQSRDYERLYSKCKITLDKHNKAYLHHMEFVEDYLTKHPKVAEYLKK